MLPKWKSIEFDPSKAICLNERDKIYRSNFALTFWFCRSLINAMSTTLIFMFLGDKRELKRKEMKIISRDKKELEKCRN